MNRIFLAIIVTLLFVQCSDCIKDRKIGNTYSIASRERACGNELRDCRAIEYNLLLENDTSSFTISYAMDDNRQITEICISEKKPPREQQDDDVVENDSDVIGAPLVEKDIQPFPISYQHKIEMFRATADDAFQNRQVAGLITILLNLEDWGDESIGISNNYFENQERDERDILRSSGLYRDIEGILREHGYRISSVSIEPGKTYRPIEDFLRFNSIDTEAVTDQLLTGMCWMEVKSTNI